MERLVGIFGRLRVFWVCFGVLTALLVGETVAMYYIHTSVRYQGNWLRLERIEDGGVVLADREGNEMRLTIETETSIHHDCEYTVTYLDKTIRYRYAFGEYSTYTFSDGSRRTEDWNGAHRQAGAYGSDALTGVQKADMRLLERLRDFYDDGMVTGLFVVLCISGAVMLLLGHLYYFYTEAMWRVQHYFSVHGGEPSDFYLKWNKRGGVMTAVFVFVCWVTLPLYLPF